MTTPVGRVLGVALLSLALGLGTAGCTGDSDSEPSAEPSPTTPPLETTATLGKVVGRIPAARADQVVPEVAAVVDGWLDAAYVAGEYPREDFADAFPGFTKGAAAEAAKDESLMTNADIGADIEGVTPTVRTVKVDVLGVKGKPVGATARVRLVFTTEAEPEQEEPEQKYVLNGRLRLTPSDGGWQIFGYDVAKGAKP